MALDKRLHPRLFKLLAMAKSDANEHEAYQARKQLERQLAKVGLTIEDLEREQREIVVHEFTLTNPILRPLLVNVIYMVMTRAGVEAAGGVRTDGKRSYAVVCGAQQFEEIKFVYGVHKAHFEREVATLVQAYIHKQQIFPEDGGSQRPNKPPTPEQRREVERIVTMMGVLEKVNVRLQLGDGKERRER